jgi:hypothetical protein
MHSDIMYSVKANNGSSQALSIMGVTKKNLSVKNTIGRRDRWNI